MPKKKADDALTELTADLQRVQADFVNFRRRAEDERRELMDLAKADVVRELLPVLDNLDRALAHVPEDLESHQWAEGVRQIAKQIQSTLRQMGVSRIEAQGQSFDPQLHEAVVMDGGDEVVTEVLQPGYKLGDRILRPAMVKVGKKK